MKTLLQFTNESLGDNSGVILGFKQIPKLGIDTFDKCMQYLDDNIFKYGAFDGENRKLTNAIKVFSDLRDDLVHYAGLRNCMIAIFPDWSNPGYINIQLRRGADKLAEYSFWLNGRTHHFIVEEVHVFKSNIITQDHTMIILNTFAGLAAKYNGISTRKNMSVELIRTVNDKQETRILTGTLPEILCKFIDINACLKRNNKRLWGFKDPEISKTYDEFMIDCSKKYENINLFIDLTLKRG